MTAITVYGLRKRLRRARGRERRQLRRSAPARCCCLLGPNGAGKTTTVEILEGHRRLPDAGRVEVLGFDPARGERALRERIGIVLQSLRAPGAR